MAALAADLGVGPTFEYRMRLALWIGMTALAPLAIYVAYYLLGPSIDNWLGVLTGRDLRRFFEHPIGTGRLRDVVEERVGQCEWSSQHDEYIWASIITCRSARGHYSWELSNLPPRPWLPRGAYVTPMSRDSADLVPEVLPPQLKDRRFIPIGRYAAGIIYDMARPAEARAWLMPFFEKALLKNAGAGGPTTR